MKNKYQKDCIVITQNVDDMFERAGCPDVIHVHGELTKMHCMACDNVYEIGYKEYNIGDKCPKCANTHIKPYIVFFGGQAPKYMDMYSAFEHLQNEDSIAVVIGTLGNVVQINANLELMDCKKILNNLEESPYIDDSQFDRVYYENATSAIEKIEADIEELWEK
jgi:NAD-dependent deacetylase